MVKPFLKKIYHPEIYQGYGGSKKYFEGWYYKIVDKREENIYAIIPGVAFDQDNKKNHCFIQILDGTHSKSVYIKYDIDTFKYNSESFEVWIGNSYFSTSKIILDIDYGEWKMTGEACFANMTCWPKTVLSPSSMGWYAFVPFMECYHGIISLDHEVNGRLNINNIPIDYTGGSGYMEKDWGKSFPSSWIWIQSNHFERRNTSFTCSIAYIPWLGRSFVGLLAGIKLDNRIYRFTTYTGAKIKKNNIEGDFAEIEIEDKEYLLKVEVKKSNSAELLSPKNGLMEGIVLESMSSTVELQLFKKNKYDKERIFSGTGRNTAVEIMGNIKEIVIK